MEKLYTVSKNKTRSWLWGYTQQLPGTCPRGLTGGMLVCRRDQFSSVQFSHSVMSDSLRPHSTQGSLSITNSRSLLKLTSTVSLMSSKHLFLCRPLLLPSIFPSIRIFSKESVLHIRRRKYWGFSFSIRPSNDWFPLGWTGWISLKFKGS